MANTALGHQWFLLIKNKPSGKTICQNQLYRPNLEKRYSANELIIYFLSVFHPRKPFNALRSSSSILSDSSFIGLNPSYRRLGSLSLFTAQLFIPHLSLSLTSVSFFRVPLSSHKQIKQEKFQSPCPFRKIMCHALYRECRRYDSIKSGCKRIVSRQYFEQKPGFRVLQEFSAENKNGFGTGQRAFYFQMDGTIKIYLCISGFFSPISHKT